MKKLFSPKKVVAIAVLSIFVLSGLLGGAFAPILNRVFASSGTQNKVISNYNIVGLPRASVVAGTTVASAGIPELHDAFTGARIGNVDGDAEGRIRLYRASSSGYVRIDSSTWTTPTPPTEPATYDDPRYVWRFYNDGGETNIQSYIYEHEVKTTQKNYSIDVPTSAMDDNGVLNFIPNTMLLGQELTLPFPNTFVDLKRNNLFDNDTKDVVALRRAVLDSFASTVKTKYTDAKYSEKLEWFKEAIFENTVIRFMYSAEVENKADFEADAVADGKTQRDYKDSNELKCKNLMVDGARTFKPTVIANYYAEYEFIHSSIKVEFDTITKTPISVERPQNLTLSEILGGSNPEENRKKQIRFDIEPAVVNNSGDLKINQPFTFNLPKVRLSSATDSSSDAWNPVTLSSNDVTSYTYIEVIHATYNSSTKEFVESGHSIPRVDERDNYTFVPEWPGFYQFVYHTTTIYGAGYTNLYGAGNVDTHVDTANGITYFKYTPLSNTFITTNELKPQFKWSVPHKVADATDAGLYADVEEGDIIATDDYDMFGIKKGTILQRYGKSSYFTESPDLENFMPTKGISFDSDITQIDGGGKLVIPAMLGQNNVGLSHSGELKYYIDLTRRDGATNKEMITFTSETSTSSSSRTFDPTKPLVIDFGAPATYAAGGKLEGWNFNERITNYRLEVYVYDNSNDKFDANKTTAQQSLVSSYSFRVVENAGYEMDDEIERPVFAGGLGVNGQVFYEDQTITFPTVKADAKFTKSDQVDVKYYIAYAATGTVTAKVIEIDDSYFVSDAAKMYFDLSRDNLKAGDILDAITANSGMLNAKVVAVAQNYYALSQSIDDDFKFVSASSLSDAEIISGTTTKAGVAFKSFTIKLYNWDYGASATIGLKGAAFDDTDSAVTIANFNAKWRERLIENSGTNLVDGISTVQQDQIIDLPTFTINYKGSAGKITGLDVATLSTTATFRVLKPITRDRVGLIGNPYVNEDIGLTAKEISNLKFRPTEIGIHTLICEVYNTGSFVSVFTATFNVVGKVDDIPVSFKSGTPTAQVGQKVVLPWATMQIGAFNFEASIAANGSKTIRATDEPDRVLVNGTTDTAYDPDNDNHVNMLTVGSYSVSGMEVGTQEEVSSTIGGEFVPRKLGTYVFTYTFKFDANALENLYISVDPNMANPTKEYTITVTGLVDGDINIEPLGDRYKTIATANSYVESDGTTVDSLKIAADPRYNEITNDNILPAMVSKNKSEIKMDSSQLSRSMTPIYETKTDGKTLQYYEWDSVKEDYKTDENTGEVIKTDDTTNGKPRPVSRKTSSGYEYLYEYGRIYLPNFDAIWREGLYGFTIDVPNVSRVQVARSESATSFIFDSYNIDNGTKDEKHYVTVADERFYYFQPQGKAYVPSKFDNDSGRYEASTSYDSLRPDGAYVVTVTMNVAGKEIQKTFEISVGDVAKPTINFANGEKEKLFKEYKIGDTFILNTKDSIRVDANGGTLTELDDNGYFANWYVARNLKVDVQLPGSGYSWASEGDGENQIRVFPEATTINPVYGSDGKLVNDHSSANRTWQFKFTEPGEYTFKFSIKSESKQPAEFTQVIKIAEPTAKGGFDGGVIWGIILIILSVGLLVAVLVYFIQTGRVTKFANKNPLIAKKAKGPATEKTETPPAKE